MAKDGEKLKVFVSYSRADLAFADELATGLEIAGFAPLIDRHSIREGEDWKKRLGALIAEAGSIVFVLSPDSAKSTVCAWEVEEAARLSKRVLPVLWRPLGDAPAPPRLSALNYVRFDEGRSLMTGVKALGVALRTDLDWLGEHTRLLQRALEWDRGNRADNRLMSGQDIADAKAWLAGKPREAPDPTELHRDFIRFSEQAETARNSAERKRAEQLQAAVRRTRMGLGATGLALALAAGLTIYARSQQHLANRALARIFAERAWSAISDEKRELAVRYALAGHRLAPEDVSIYRAPLASATATNIATLRQHFHSAAVSSLSMSNDGAFLVSGSRDGFVNLLDAQTMELRQKLSHDGAIVTGAAFSPNGSVLASITIDGTIHLWNINSGKRLATLEGHSDAVAAAEFSGDGSRLVTASYDKSTKLWDLSSGLQLAHLEGHSAAVLTAAFSPDGSHLLTGSEDGNAILWDASTGRALAKFKDHTNSVVIVAFSQDGKQFLTGSLDRELVVRETGLESSSVKKYSGHLHGLRNAAFSSNGNTVNAVDQAGNAYIWDVPRSRILAAAESGSVAHGIATFHNTGGLAAIVGGGGDRIRIWEAASARLIFDVQLEKESRPTRLLWKDRKLFVGEESGEIASYDLTTVLRSWSEMKAAACATNDRGQLRFSWMEVANDVLIRQQWDLNGSSRDVCE